jgi:peptidoglycan/xylan/chitin deacetylase (PgdA/CDA1 family)
VLPLAGPDPPNAGLPRERIAALAAAGFGIGFHTRRHDILTQLDGLQLDRAMDEGRTELEQTAGRSIYAIAYPYGRTDRRVAAAARRAGFRIGFSIARCAVTPEAHPLVLGRLDPFVLAPRQPKGPSHGAFALGVVRTLLIPPEAR